MAQVVDRVATHGERVAILCAAGEWTYADIDAASRAAASSLLDGADDLREARVAFLAGPGVDYVATLLGIWRAGGVAVPLCVGHPRPELDYVLGDSGASTVVADAGMADRAGDLASAAGLRLLTTESATALAQAAYPDVDTGRRAMMLYTSGTTSRPKGVVTTHANIAAQVTSLVRAWEWAASDRILHVLPLHHIHGIVNALLCALWSGAACEMMDGFSADVAWTRIRRGGVTLFMAVPTIYARLIAAWEAASEGDQKEMSDAARGMRLMVSGSAALPVPTLERWEAITGQRLLERYGMTEIGMGLSNPLHGERLPGSVGTPLPDVEARLVDDGGTPVPDGEQGEIEIRGPGVFGEYWRRPDATEASFRDGWFRTGDVAIVEDGRYRVLGRQSVDIIKTGGYKVSALEIESALREHDLVDECAVVGVPDEEWGERVAVAVVTADGHELTLETLREWGKDRLAVYKVPSLLRVRSELPRNAMGKVVKPDVRALFADE